MLFIGMLTVLLFGGCQSQAEDIIEAPQATADFNFTVLKAGQTEAILMQTQNHSIILDCGERDNGDELAEVLSEFGR